MSPAVVSLPIWVGGEALWINAARVRSVTRVPAITPVPLAPAALKGVANIDGTVLPIVSLSRLLERPDTKTTRLLVFEGERPCGLLADSVGALSGETADDVSLEIDRRLRPLLAHTNAAPPVIVRPHDNKSLPGNDTVALLFVRRDSREFAFKLSDVSEVRRRSRDAPGGASESALANRHARIVTLRKDAKEVGFAVDEVRGVVRVTPDSIDPFPAVLRRRTDDDHIQAICRLDGGLRLVPILAPHAADGSDLPSKVVSERAEKAVSVDGQTDGFLAFRVGDAMLAFNIDAVQRVIAVPTRIARVPNVPAFMEGVINVGGEVLPLIDAERRQSASSPGLGRRVIVAQSRTFRAGFVVDDVVGLVRIERVRIATQREGGAQSVDRIATLPDGRTLRIVSTTGWIAQMEREAGAAFAMAAA